MGDVVARDLVVLSHLRWDGVWQRPHHIVSRLASGFERVWFVEEPSPRSGDEVRPRLETCGPVTRVLVDIPWSRDGWPIFGDPPGLDHAALVSATCGPLRRPVVWLYAATALPIARELDPSVLVYDVMDDLSSFRGAPPQMRLRHLQALAEADVVFTGGHSLHERVLEHRRRPSHTLCLPSGVEPEHFRRVRRPQDRPVAGYVGVIDERLDLELLAGLAARLPNWRIRMVGPVTKIDEASLPRAENIEYVGKRAYAELPDIMASFDVALMPFAHNEATASISPTKTLEYLAAGLPVVSTRIRDVMRDFDGLVTFAESAEEVARACEAMRDGRLLPPRDEVTSRLHTQSWDALVVRMQAMVATHDAASEGARASA